MCCEPTRSSRRLPALLWTLCIALVFASPGHAKLLVASQGDERIIEYDDNDGSYVSSFVDPVIAGFAFPGGIAVRPSDGQLFVSSSGSGEILVYDTGTGLLAPPAAATGLLAPGAMVFDAAGSNLYFIADIPNGPDSDAALRRLALPSGTVTTLGSDAVASFAGIALEGGFLYVSDSLAGTVVRYATSGGIPTTVVTGLASPAGILFLSSTAMLIAESAADSVVEYHESGGNWSFDREVLSAAAGVDGPYGLARAPNGSLSVAGANSNEVVSVDLTTLVVTGLVSAGQGLAVPGQITWDASTLLVASRASNTVPYFDTGGAPTGIVARGLTAPADSGVGRTTNGNLLVASSGANNVTEYDGITGAIVRSLSNACPLSFTDPFDVVEDAAGKIYVTCAPTDGVRRFDPIGISLPFITAGSGGLGSPRGLAIGPSGNFLVSSVTGEVLEYDGTTGAFVGVFIDSTGNSGGPVDPYGLRFHSGSLFVSSFFPNEVKEFDAMTGAFISTFVASGAGGLVGPKGLAFGPNGDLYVTSQGDDTVKRYDGTNGSFIESFVTAGSGGLDAPFDLEFLTAATGQPVPSISRVGYSLLVFSLAWLGSRNRVGRSARAGKHGDRS